MSRIGRYHNPYTSFEFEGRPPAGATCEVLGLATQDRAACHAALWLPAGGRANTAVMLMHPRADFFRHYAVPGLLAAGYAVLSQNSRSAGNDSMLVHEHVLLDVAAGVSRLRDLGLERIVAVGNSGGGSLYAFYAAQAAAAPAERLKDTAAGDPFDLGRFELPPFDAIVFLAAHPGEGAFLLEAIDASVTDETDPCSCDLDFDMYDARNGFRPPPEPSRYSTEFVARYRRAQRARVERIDARAREMVAERRTARRRAKQNADDVAAVRRATAVPFFTVYRTEADPRYVDLSIDPSERDYGSLFGHRPDIINYGPFGFARLVTPEAWLSTWSGLSSRAVTATNAGRFEMPALVLGYSADNGVFPVDARSIYDGLVTTDKKIVTIAGDHYGHPAPGRQEPGRVRAIAEITGWLAARGW